MLMKPFFEAIKVTAMSRNSLSFDVDKGNGGKDEGIKSREISSAGINERNQKFTQLILSVTQFFLH